MYFTNHIITERKEISAFEFNFGKYYVSGGELNPLVVFDGFYSVFFYTFYEKLNLIFAQLIYSSK